VSAPGSGPGPGTPRDYLDALTVEIARLVLEQNDRACVRRLRPLWDGLQEARAKQEEAARRGDAKGEETT
jgi:hypothetical protein